MVEHDSTLDKFISKFNNVKPYEVSAMINPKLFIADAFFNILGKVIPFDWMKKYDKQFTSKYFPFNTLRCFDRKWNFKMDIIIIQNKDESAIACAWSKDFGKPFETICNTSRGLAITKMRETNVFLTISMDNLQTLKDILIYGVE